MLLYINKTKKKRAEARITFTSHARKKIMEKKYKKAFHEAKLSVARYIKNTQPSWDAASYTVKILVTFFCVSFEKMIIFSSLKSIHLSNLRNFPKVRQRESVKAKEITGKCFF